MYICISYLNLTFFMLDQHTDTFFKKENSSIWYFFGMKLSVWSSLRCDTSLVDTIFSMNTSRMTLYMRNVIFN